MSQFEVRAHIDECIEIAALNSVRNVVFSALHTLVTDRFGEQHRSEWMSAYAFSGTGSGLRRAGEIVASTRRAPRRSVPDAARGESLSD
jgi:hypothetical protein